MTTPTKIGRYEVISELGRGGMATVYRAFDPKSEREVAIKVLPREMLHDPTFRSRFEREIKTLVGLEHSAITPVYDVGEEDGQPYFVMRYMAGGSLANVIKKKKLSLQDTARIIEKIAKGLAYAHKKGIIHRDLKPDNILFDENNDPFISDFGIAKYSENTGRLTGSRVIGTPEYMSPEQAQGEKLDGRSDVYSLGVIIYQMLSGQLPYRADTAVAVALKHVSEPVPEISKTSPSLPSEADDFIQTAMAKKKSKRYATPIDLAKALNFIAFGAEGTFTTGLYNKTPSRGQTGLIIIGVVLLVAVIGFFLLRNQLFSVEPSIASPMPATHIVASPVNSPVETSKPTATAIATSTIISVTKTPAPIYAPACTAEIAIPAPVLAELDKICVEKNPYTLLSIPEGSTFEASPSEFSCKTEKTRNGKTSISCTGKPAFSFNLKVCAPLAAEATSGKCAEAQIFSPAEQCCLAPPPEGAGCAVFKIDIRSCP